MLTPDLPDLVRRAVRIRLVLADIDGVLTDGGVYLSARGEELKRFSVRDGIGVERLREHGIATALVSREDSPIAARGADKLGVEHVVSGARDKLAALERLLRETGIAAGEVAYIGDDVTDRAAIDAVAAAGLTGAPADAMPALLDVVHYRCRAAGGRGAFRDFAEWILGMRHAAALASGRS